MKSARLQNLLKRKGAIALFFGLLLSFQLLYGFRFPSVGDNGNWLPISDYLPKFSAEGHDNFLMKTFLPMISPEYRLNSDIGEYLIVARDFSPEYLEGHQYLNRPLYSLLIFFASRITSPIISTSYGILFGLAILINFVFAVATAFLFFILVQKFFSFKVAFLSALLLIFSPFVHSFMTQPIPEMLTAFGVIFSLYLLYNYAQNPSLPKLAMFSLIAGVMMLSKMFFATPLLILLLAIYYRRFREGITFAMYFAIPVVLWYLWVTKIWGIPYYIHEVQHWNMGIWLFSIFELPLQDILKIFIDAVPNFINVLLRGFIFIPVVFALIWAMLLRGKTTKNFCSAFVFSIFLLSFLAHIYAYRHAFLLFPIVYPMAVLGIEWTAAHLEKYNRRYSLLFQTISILAIIFVSSTNIYRFYNYLGHIQ